MTGQKKKPGASERSWLVRDYASGLSLFSIRFHIRFYFRADRRPSHTNHTNV